MMDAGSIILECDWEASVRTNDSITAFILPFDKYLHISLKRELRGKRREIHIVFQRFKLKCAFDWIIFELLQASKKAVWRIT